MFRHYFKYIILFVLLFSLHAKDQYIHHDLMVELKPGEKYVKVTNNGSCPNPQYLQGSNSTLSVTTFDVGPAILDGRSAHTPLQ